MPDRTVIDRIEAFALSCAVDGGPVSSLAPMPVRNGLLLRMTASDGAWGWGEAWCNYPPKGNLAKLALLEDPIGPAVLGRSGDDWSALRPCLEADLARMIIHTGEPGPFAHCLAALDMAAADLAARRQGVGLSTMLGDAPDRRVRVYASTPGVDGIETLAARLSEQGHSGLKLKVGFDAARDHSVLSRFRENDPVGMYLGVDANQNWTVGQAIEAIAELSKFDLSFVEEPISAHASAADWGRLARNAACPLAAGENILSEAAFANHVDDGSLRIIQPDVAKWGGISGCMAAGRHALDRGAGVTLHYMGTALGLAASFHALAALGGGGRVELDANPNPLRTDLGPIDLRPVEGFVPVPQGDGIGFVPDTGALDRFCIGRCEVK